MEITLDEYTEFVEEITSEPSMKTQSLIARLQELHDTYSPEVEMSQLLTGAIGVNSESGEFLDIIKKVVFQGKPLDNVTMEKLKKELGDVFFYLMHCCSALSLDPIDVIVTNKDKLMERFPEGHFTTTRSENRKAEH